MGQTFTPSYGTFEVTAIRISAVYFKNVRPLLATYNVLVDERETLSFAVGILT